ncbi:MAG TPA: response regulator transcription factor [Bacteroidia bacterium]|jgi:DNA-binding NarL/FixJ family response regulator|nr:response regulator transcription factor [Bacteroidia bacterium]
MVTTVVLGHTNYLVREGLKSLIFSRNEFLFEGEASNAEELVKLVTEKKPEVIVIDHLDQNFGISVLRRIVAENPKIGILTISDKPTKWMLADALAAGIVSYLLRDCEKEEIIDAIVSTSKHEQFFCGKILNGVMRTAEDGVSDSESILCNGVRISEREAEIIRYVSEGLTNKEVADKLHLSAHTVTTHRKNIMAKIGVNNTAGLVLFAIKNNIVTPNHFLFNTN